MTETAVPHLSPRELRYLWLMAQGSTPTEAGKLMQTKSTPALSTRVREKLNARTTAQAVWVAAELALIGPYEDCGTLQGYQAHQTVGQDACRACRRAFAGHTERNGLSRSKPLSLTEAELRLLKCYDAGRTFRQVLKNWGCSQRTLDTVRTSLYRKLDVSHLPQQVRHQAALEEGRRRGHLTQHPALMPPDRRPGKWHTTALTALELRTLIVLANGTSLCEAGKILDGIAGSSVSALDVLSYGHGERRDAAIKEARNRGYAL